MLDRIKVFCYIWKHHLVYAVPLLVVLIGLTTCVATAKAEIAQHTYPFNLLCGPHNEITLFLKRTYNEDPSFKATAKNGRITYWFLDETASSMSIVNEDASGESCIIWSTTCESGECLAPAFQMDLKMQGL